MEPLVGLRRAGAELLRRLDLVTEADWDRPTPCEGWTVRDLLRHVDAGNRMTVLALHGGSREETTATMAADHLGDEPAAAVRESVARQEAAFAEPGAMERVCHHPMFDTPGSQLLGFRVGDLAVHAWDLARALGADETLDAELVEDVWRSTEPMAPVIGSIGVFGTGPSGTVPEGAPLQQRLLDLMGRRP
ncbi:MAG: TIGR03086 family protein [Acidimicrobiales bacterium]|nr:TIGR03086 family protein [Acidimicrobiales bacterium]